jgi:cell division protein FtsW (lipid II flippase)
MKTLPNIKEAPYGLLLLTAIVLLFALVFPPVATIDFQDKTMFSVPLTTMVWIIPFLLIAFWLLYVLTNRFLYSVTITRVHVLITVFVAILIVTVLYSGIKPLQPTSDRHELIGNANPVYTICFRTIHLSR